MNAPVDGQTEPKGDGPSTPTDIGAEPHVRGLRERLFHTPRSDKEGKRWGKALWPIFLAVVVVALFSAVLVYGDVIIQYNSTVSTGGTASPFNFVNGGNYVTANGQGFVTNTYPNAQQTSVGVVMNGADGAAGTYALDVLEVDTVAATTTPWTLVLDVSTALVATGVNAAYISYCTVAPTGIADTLAPLSFGTDANGNPWTIFQPLCTGTQYNLPLTALTLGTAVTIPSGTAATTPVLYISFMVAVTNTGATTSTPAAVSLLATA